MTAVGLELASFDDPQSNNLSAGPLRSADRCLWAKFRVENALQNAS